MPQQSQAPQQSILGGNMTLGQLYEAAPALVEHLCSVFTLPVEYALRPNFGTRYFSPVTTFLSCVVMIALAGFSAFTSALSIPFGRAPLQSHGHGLIGIGILTLLFVAGNLIHGSRTFRRMLHPELEDHSEYEGPALSFLVPLFSALPHGKQFWVARIVYEPITVGVATIALYLTHVLDRPATIYLLTVAVLLAVKCYMGWYCSWLSIRIVLDGKAAAPVIAAIVNGTATEEQMASVHLAGLPSSVPAQVKAEAISMRTGSLPANIQSLISPVEKPASASMAFSA